MEGMNFADFTESPRIEAMLDDPRYVVEQKMDGTRVLVEIDSEGIRYLTRSGDPLKHTAATQHLDALTDTLQTLEDFCRVTHTALVLDGELMIGDGTYHVFDLPEFNSGDGFRMHGKPYEDRRRALVSLLQPLHRSRRVHVVRSARTSEEKRALLAATRERGAEGVMIKDLYAAYEPGARVGHSVKVKHVKEADVVVITAQRGVTEAGNPSGSAEFGVYGADGHLVPLGSCSLIGKPEVKPGDVITVAYLYRQDDGGLVQPRLRRVREDKDMTECGFDQFPEYSRDVL